jgi:hypothetical protein
MLLPIRALDPVPQLTIAGIATALVVLALTAIDAEAVRFMAETGHAGWRIVARRGRALLLLVAGVVPVLLIAQAPNLALMVAAVTGLGLALMAARILAYCAYARRTANLMLTGYAAALALAGLIAPLLVPLALAAIAWRLDRSAAAKRWMLQ